MKMFKEILKATAAVIAVNILTYLAYLLLLFSGALDNYELEEDWAGNMPIYLFFFCFSFFAAVVCGWVVKFERVHYITFAAETLVLSLAGLSTNWWGAMVLLQYVGVKTSFSPFTNDISVSIISALVSTALMLLAVIGGSCIRRLFTRKRRQNRQKTVQ